jgi:hypothetical protein
MNSHDTAQIAKPIILRPMVPTPLPGRIPRQHGFAIAVHPNSSTNPIHVKFVQCLTRSYFMIVVASQVKTGALMENTAW